jgi:hypothetical protein
MFSGYTNHIFNPEDGESIIKTSPIEGGHPTNSMQENGQELDKREPTQPIGPVSWRMDKRRAQSIGQFQDKRSHRREK